MSQQTTDERVTELVDTITSIDLARPPILAAARAPMTEAEIVTAISKQFRTFGGGRVSDSNPLTIWQKDDPPSFAMGVPVLDVVRFVLECAR